jgi:hypothetical protein
MRMVTVVAWLLLASCSPNPQCAQDCSRLDVTTRGAMVRLIDARYRDSGPSDPEDERADVKTLAAHHDDVLPCLLDIYRNGPGKAGLWHLPAPPPADGHLLIDVIARVDPGSAIVLYRRQRDAAPTDSVARLVSNLALARLGDGDVLGELLGFIEKPTSIRPADREQASALVPGVLSVIAQRNYRPALESLRRLESTRTRDPYLPVYIAQLAGDVDLLRIYAGQPERVDAALRSLLWMGRRDIVEQEAKNLGYRYRDIATGVLRAE